MSSKEIVFPYKAETGIESIKDEMLFLAVTVAASGKHNVLVWGAAGCGKTVALMAMREILPAPTEEELSEIRQVYKAANYPYEPSEAPFRMPHQTASVEGTGV